MKRIISLLLTITLLMNFGSMNSSVVYAANPVPESVLEMEAETENASNVESITESETALETESELETIEASEFVTESEKASVFESVSETENVSEAGSISESDELFWLGELSPDTECNYGDVGFDNDDSLKKPSLRRSARKNQVGICRDTVLILDASNSMREKPNAVMKAAAIKFCKSVLEADGTNRVAIVVYNTNVVGRMNFSDDLDQLTAYISTIGTSGLTNTTAALAEAKHLMDTYSTPTATKNIVLLSDGYPVTGPKQDAGKYNYVGISQSYPYANAAYEYYVNNLMNNYNVYTLGFFHSITNSLCLSYVQQFMMDIQNKGYYEVTNIDELEFTFGDVAEDIINDNSNCPIVIVPGIMGSQLYSGSTKVWVNTKLTLNPALRLDQYMSMDKSINVHNYNYENSQRKDPINQSLLSKGEREYGAIGTYRKLVDGIIERFSDENGNCTRDVYVFSYDFRRSNVDSAQELCWYIDDILSYNKEFYNKEFTQVDIVAHSMGGLVTSEYIRHYGTDKIHRVITAGTPYEGAPKLQNSVLTENVVDNGALDFFLLYTGGLTKNCKASFPAIAELAPTDVYFNGHSTNFERYTGQKQEKKKIYTTLNLSEYHDVNSMIFNTAARAPYDDALTFHKDLKTDAGYNLLLSLDNSYFSVGINQKTIAGLKFNDGTDLSSLKVDDVKYETIGDGTVPYDSGTIMRHLNALSNNRVIKFETTHTGLVGGDKKREETNPVTWICDILSTGKSNIESDIEQNKKYIVIRIACPVDVVVEKNGEALNSTRGQMQTETSYGVLDFVGNGDIKMLCVDDSHDYRIQLNGTDQGTMDYAIRYFDEDGNLINEYEFFEVPITETTRIETGSDQNDIKLCVDEDADGTVDYELYPEGYEPKTGMTKVSDTCYQYTAENMDVLYEITAKYGNVYHINMTVKNKTNDTIHDWTIEYDSTDKINNIWNGMVTDNSNKTIVKNAGYNQDIPALESISFGYMANFNQDIQIPTYFKLLGETISLDEADCDIHYQVDADWGSGYNASIQLTNTTANTIEDWGIEFDFPDTIENIWGAQIVSKTESHYILANQGYNQNIGAGQTVCIGFTATAVGEKTKPVNCRITHIETK